MGDIKNTSFPVLPHFVIVGAAKAGTTALVKLLNRHPVLKKSRGEAHFFDKNEYLLENLDRLDDDQVMCKVRMEYADKWNWREDDLGKIFFEKTPRYLILPDVPELIEKVCPWKPKILVVLRDPIDRLQSQHKMNLERNRGTAGLTLDQAIDAELATLRELGLTRAPLLSEYTDELWSGDGGPALSNLFEIPSLSPAERRDRVRELYKDVLRSHDALLERGMYATQLEPWLARFWPGDSLLVIHNERLRREPVTVWNEIQGFLEIPQFDLSEDIFGQNYSPNKGNYRESFSNATLAFLRRIYKPYNDRLADLLGEEWRGVWDR